MWKFEVVELYCGIYWEYQRHCNKYYYRMEPERDFEVAETVENPQYDPSFPKPTPPAFCKRMVDVDCLKNNCIHIAYCNAATDSEETDLKKSIVNHPGPIKKKFRSQTTRTSTK